MKDFIKRILIFTLVFVNMMNINTAFAETETVSLTIRPVVNEKKIDKLINAGMLVKKDGEEVLEDTKKELELGTTITIRAVDGHKSFFRRWERPTGVNRAEFLAIFGSPENTPELTFKITEEFKRKNIKILEASYNLFTEIDSSRTDLSKGEVEIVVTGKGANLQSKKGYPLGESGDNIRLKAIPKAGYEFERWEFICALPIIGPTSILNKDVSETDPEIDIKLTPIPEIGAYPANYLPVIAHFKESEKQEYIVSFNTNGGNSLDLQRIKLGEKVEKPIDPVKEGYKFLGWYIDKELSHPFDFNINIEQDIILYAKWKDNNKSIDPNDYIMDIKIPINPKNPDINTTFFHRYEIKDNKIVFYIGKDNKSWKNPTFRSFLGFTDPVMGFGGLMNYKLIIETKGIKEIKVDNYVYDETTSQENGEIQKSTAIKNFVGSSSQWKEGIWFNDFGTRVVYTDKDGKIITDSNRSRFDKDNPPEFTFVTDDEDEFKLTWEAIKVEPKEEEIEKRIELTVQPSPTTIQLHDGQVNAGIRDGGGTIKYKELKLGEKANITAIDGNKSFFSQWYISMLEDNKFKELFGVEKTTRDIEFTITEDFFDVAKNYKLKMEAMYKTYTIVDTSQTDGDCGEVITKVYGKNLKSKDGFNLADSKDIIEFKAVPKEGYKFSEWEFLAPNITGPGSMNPEVNLKSPVIEIELPYMASVGSEHNYHLKLKAIFTEEGNEIEEILHMADEEFIQGYDKYQLPKVLGVKYSDGSKGLETAIWDRNIESAKLGENIFIGTILGTDKTVEFKVTMRKIIDIKEEYKFQELTIYNNDWFGEGRWYKLPEKARVMVSDGSSQLEKEINIKNWQGSDVMADGKTIIYYKHGTYETEGIIEGFNKNIKFKLNVKKESEKAKFNVVFNTNGGSEIPPQEVVEGKVSKPNDPVKEGYRFIAWYMDDKLSEEFDFDTSITEDIILYSKWEEVIKEELKILSVELLKDKEVIGEGSFKGKNITIFLPKETSKEEVDNLKNGKYKLKIIATEGASVSQEGGYEGDWSSGYISNNMMVGEIKKFTVAKDGQSTEYYIEIKEFHNENKTHTVTFDTNGGNNISSQTVKDGNIAIKPSNPTKDGYKFINWYTDSSLINIFNFNTAITEDITLYAKWEKVSVPVIGKYTVDFNTNGGNSISSQLIDEGRKANEPSNPTRPGYSFVNWYTDSSLINIFNFNTAITEDITLYAKWDKAAEESNSARITKFSLLGYEGSIDDRNGYITVYIPYNMELNGLVPNITLSEGATISPRGDVAVSFNRSVYYTVYAKDGSKKEYRVSIDMPRENSSRENYWDDYYDNYKRKRDDYYKKRSEISWWEMSQEAKKEREKEALKDNRDELLILKERSKIMNEVGKIESRFKNKRGSLYIREGYNTIEIKPTVSNFAEGHSNMIIIPKGLLSSLSKGEYNYITYTTGVVNIDIYPFMETITGLRLNLKDVSKDIRKKWDKVKGKGFIFEVESDSTKGGLSYEFNLEKKYPIEKIRFVQYDYTKGNFKDASPEKWYIFDGKIRCEKVSAGIYGIIYKD